MKFIWPMLFSFISLTCDAQNELREATPEERKVILSKDGETKLKEFGHSIAFESEKNLISEALIKDTLKKGHVDPLAGKTLIQKLKEQTLTEDQIKFQIDSISDQYYASLQLQQLDKVLPPAKQLEYQKKFEQLQLKEEQGELSHGELDEEISKLDKEINSSATTEENNRKAEIFKASLLKSMTDNTFVKAPLMMDPNKFTAIKVIVPKDFSLTKFNSNDCVLDLPGTLDPKVSQLDTYMKNITGNSDPKKPLFHQIYFAWGYNRGLHSDTDVTFKTSDGTFTIKDTHSNDRPSPFDPKIYFNPTTITIPQYNMELGLMFNEKWGVELKADHMKLVFDNSRPYEITGDYNRKVVIKNDHPTNFWDQEIPVDFSVAKAKKDATWMNFEHSDGYNYVSAGLVYNQNLFKTKNEKFAIDARFGGGAGLMIPKTKVMIHQDQRWNHHGLDNKFHVAGGGVHAEAKLKFTFWNSIFLQASTRGTYIKVKDALVDGSEARMEHDQPIASVQFIGQVGYQHTLGKKKKKKIPME